MKKVLLGILICFVAISCDDTPEKVTTDMINISPSDGKLPELTFETKEFDFGRITEGEKVKFTFEFENTGEAPLVLSRVEPSCGCTTADDWSTKPYGPGEEGVITIEFDSNKRPGKQTKSISVIANTVPAVTKLQFTGEVIGPQSE